MVVGAGLAGLACARRLTAAGRQVLVIETQDQVGGRVRTDMVDGFRLDRGFQVFLTAYPEAGSVLDYDALALHRFYPGALVQRGRRRYRFADPWRRPLASLAGLLAPIASIADAARIARLRSAAMASGSITGRDQTTLEYLRELKLSDRVIERFFRPFFGGVFLERTLSTPADFLRFVFAMFSRGFAALPNTGMQAIPQQLADGLPPNALRLNTRVRTVARDAVQLASGEQLRCQAVVIAADAVGARQLLPDLQPTTWNSTTTVYYRASHSPLREGVLVLNGNGVGRVNHVCVPSDTAPGYAPGGQSLISVSLLGVATEDDDALDRAVREELGVWFGPDVTAWTLLRVYRIEYGLPVAAPEAGWQRSSQQDGVFICGDYLESPSIEGALIGGRKTAEAVLNALNAE